jgi:D-arabinose 5-phosphate isomerase GutQ/beta-phosphoglucomutase-like phosphatase (HAD superfamily)
MSIFDYDLFIFDFDGTLIDTEKLHLKAWNMALSSFLNNADEDEDSDEIMSFRDYQKYFHSIKSNYNKDFLHIKYGLDYEKYDEIYSLKQKNYESMILKEDVYFIKGAYDFLNKLLEMNKKFIIVSNTSERFINIFKNKIPILKKALGIFTKELFMYRKPHPECYIKISNMYPDLKKIGFEDSLTGINALYQVADIKPVLIYDENYYYTDYILNNYRDVLILNDYNYEDELFKMNLETCHSIDNNEKSDFIESILNNNIEELQNNFWDMKKSIEIISVLLKNMKHNSNIYLSGMGKSGYICKKSVSTWQSLSIKSYYIDLPNLSHGDFGVFRDDDVLILVSNSGNTDEVVYIIDYIKNTLFKKITIISIVANNDSKMEKLSDYTFILNKIKEADKIDMTPSTSSMIFMSLLDAIGIAIRSDISIEEFKDNHPNGALGLKI